MNKIYQQKMERYSEEYVFENCERERGVPLVKDAYQNGWHNALQNQWISVEEALPEKRQNVLVAILDTKSNTYFFGFDNIDDDNGEFLRDKNGFAIENDSHKITHWMPIPSLKGGEE